MTSGALHRLSAFTSDPEGGNPAGVWIGESLPTSGEMQRIAAEVGYSETAFVAPAGGRERTVRYYSPEIELPFCGRATIATGVLPGRIDRHTRDPFDPPGKSHGTPQPSHGADPCQRWYGGIGYGGPN